MSRRIIKNSPLRQAKRLDDLAVSMRRQLGDAQYLASIAAFTPFVRSEMQRGAGCVLTAANRVIERLKTQGADLAVQRLVTCAAVELALAS